jgi:hypothetical protein
MSVVGVQRENKNKRVASVMEKMAAVSGHIN